jgi:hypothetical protein
MKKPAYSLGVSLILAALLATAALPPLSASVVPLAVSPPPLGAAATFSILAALSLSASSAGTVVSGDLGLSPGLASARTGPWTVGGVEYLGPGSLAGTAQVAALAAFNDMAVQSSDGLWSGSTSPAPGVWSATVDATFSGTLTLNGGYTDVWVFQIGRDMTFSGQVIMAGNAQACHVFWQIGRDASIISGTTFAGTLIAYRDVTLFSGATVDGRIMSLTDSLATDGNMISGPSCAQAPTSTATATATRTGTATSTRTGTPTATATRTGTTTATPTATATGTATATATRTGTTTATPTATRTGTATASRTATPTRTATATATRTGTTTSTPTATRTGTATATRTATPTGTSTATATRTGTPTATATATRTGTATATPTATPTGTASATATATATPTATPTGLPQASASILTVLMQPTTLNAGEVLAVDVAVMNTGSVPLCSEGPFSGFTYDEGTTFSVQEVPGCLRVGIDYGGRTQPKDHPYRWGWSGQLDPGQTVHVAGGIRLMSPRASTDYWVGLVDEAVTWIQDNAGRTAITVLAATATPTVTPTPTQTPTGPPPEVPEAGTLPLMASGLGALATWLGWQRTRRGRTKRL